MLPLEKIQTEIKLLPHEDFVKLRDWIIEQDWKAWDKKLKMMLFQGNWIF